jgi:hypothetical protein
MSDFASAINNTQLRRTKGSRTLGSLHEGTVSRKTALPSGAKTSFRVVSGLAGPPENGYIRRNLHVLIRSRLRVGPSGPALFYYLNDP